MAIQILNSFITGVFWIALPLMMEERNIDIVTMGFVFASMPVIFQVGRMAFAIVSDFWGRKPFFLLSGCLGIISSTIYTLAYTAVEFLFGKVIEGVKSASLWAVNRAFFLENSRAKWKALVRLRTTTYISTAAGSLLAGFLVVQLLYERTLMLCSLMFTAVIPLSLLLSSKGRKRLSASSAFYALDFRKKSRIFKVCFLLFFVMGLSFGFVGGFVYPLFLSSNGFDAEIIGTIMGLQILLAGLISHVFSARFEIRKLILASGMMYTILLVLIGLSGAIFAGILVVAYGFVEGLLSIGQEGILTRITDEGSYGTDIGLLWTGHHVGRTFSLAMAGLVISWFGFSTLFLISALTYVVFYAGSYIALRFPPRDV
ncbi:MAG: MFS transporter [Candidatus Bathyarchaeota archaeon]|jgi:MFS family permease|nr:MAG: MFS transporter [Candidatus Bathyarchaeota archaeon]